MVEFVVRIPCEDTDSDGQVDAVRVTSPALTDLEAALSDTAPASIYHDSARMSFQGVTVTPKYAVISGALAANNAIVAAVTDKKIRVLAYSLIADAAVVATWRSASNPISGAMSIAANGGLSAAFCPVGHFETVANEALNILLSATNGVRGHLTYIEV